MNPSIKSAFPRAILLGVDDASIQTQPLESVQDTQHIPLVFLRTPKGPEEITVIPTSLLTAIYGEEVTQANGIYHTHQSEVVTAAAKAGNATIAVKRILGSDAKAPSIKFYTKVVTKDNDVSATIVNKKQDSSDSKFYELLNIDFKSKGVFGEQYGISITPADEKTQMIYASTLNGFVYELRLFRRDPISQQRNILYTNNNDQRALFCFNPNNAYAQDNPYYLINVIKEQYNSDFDSNLDTFGTVTLYEDAFAALHQLLKKNNLTTAENYWQYDILSAGKLTLSKDLVYNFTDGNDGYATANSNYISMKINFLEEYDAFVYNYLTNLSEDSDLVNMAKLPFSIIYDSGFSMRTKLALRNILRLRPDVIVGLSSFMVANHYEDIDGSIGFEYYYNDSQENAIAIASSLKSAFSLIPESQTHGTPTMRGFITIQSGINTSSSYNARQSIIIDLVEKFSRYMGQTLRWNPQASFDTSPNNELKGWVNVNFTYRPTSLKETAWDAGIIWVENKDTSTMFYPAYQTIYPDDTSVLNNIFTVMACCYLNKLAHRTWATVSGDSKLAQAALVDKISDIIETATNGIFDNRFTIKANTYFTNADNARGYSWTTDIELAAEVAKTVGIYKITAHRAGT